MNDTVETLSYLRGVLLAALFSGAVAHVSGIEEGGKRVHRLLLLPLRDGNKCPQPVIELAADGCPIVTEALHGKLIDCLKKHEEKLTKKRASIAKAREKLNRGRSA